MSKIALEHGATIDKYVGDAILAFFGDPDTRGVRQDALACVRMAIAMQRRMQELQSEWREAGLEKPFQLRIGINTGYCTVGNFGSEDRMDYTIIGGEVNLASRLQSHAEPGGILLTHETYSLVRDHFAADEQNPIELKGFAKPVRCYRIRLDTDHAEDTGDDPGRAGRPSPPARSGSAAGLRRRAGPGECAGAPEAAAWRRRAIRRARAFDAYGPCSTSIQRPCRSRGAQGTAQAVERRDRRTNSAPLSHAGSSHALATTLDGEQQQAQGTGKSADQCCRRPTTAKVGDGAQD